MMIKLAYRAALVAGIFILPGACTNLHASSRLTTTLQQVFNQHEFDVKPFGPARWIEGGSAYTTIEPPAASPESAVREIVRVETLSGKRTVLVAASQLVPAHAASPLVIEDYAWSEDNRSVLIYTNSMKVWRQKTRGDYWVLDLSRQQLKKLGGNAASSSLMFAQFSPDGKEVAYVRANNIYVEDIGSGHIRQITTDGSFNRINGTSDWVNEEEFNIRNGFCWSPDGNSIAYFQFDTTGVGVFTLINDTVSEYPTLKQFAYPQVGTTNSSVRVGVVNARGGPTRWMMAGQELRNHYIAAMAWAPNSNQVVLERINRLQNDLQILIADASTGSARQIYEDHDAAWIDAQQTFQWADKGKSLVALSERDGWRHAYKFALSGGPPRLLTSFAADVVALVGVDDNTSSLYYLASPKNATQQYLYQSSFEGDGSGERLTPQGHAGTHSYDISPDGKWAFHTFSTFDQPPVVELIQLPDHRPVRVLENNEELARKVSTLSSSPVEFFQVAIRGGAILDGWMIKPKNFDAAKKYPVLVFAYGEPAQTTVNDKWAEQRGIFHRAIANDGYIVVNFDNQGTPAPKGRAWRKCIYRQIGVLASAQQAEAILQFALERQYVDTSRMAVWGWSGGGSMTLNLMFRFPGLFVAGMSVAPIADQHDYDTIYQERYMGLPADNSQGYHDGSPINFAEGLEGKLLIVHGSGDDNCHYKVTELLLNRLVELGKPFDFMDYPNRTHAIAEGPGTSFHLYALLARYLEEHVPAGGRPQ
jgi:dipeptidyl-peptidase-4